MDPELRLPKSCHLADELRAWLVSNVPKELERVALKSPLEESFPYLRAWPAKAPTTAGGQRYSWPRNNGWSRRHR